MKCPFCGTDNPPGETFCSNCGGYLDANASSTATIATSGSSTGATTTGGGGGGNSRTLTPNAKLQNGRYVVEKILGQGGMGAAVLVRDTRVSNKAVVIKELVSEDGASQEQREEDVRNFQREVETLANLDHPLIPTVTDSFQEGSRYYMVQEYVPGENLEDHMERIKKPMPEDEALRYASQVLDILVYLNEQNPPIVHRDIKPANIIIGSRDKRAHLVDFGIARVEANRNAKRKQTSALGTPGYAPPEQYQGNADGRSDLYALAATLHHVLTNRDPRNYPPFQYPLARTLNKQLSPEIERVLQHALEINANDRYQKAISMKEDIDEILTQRFSVGADTSSYTLTSGPITTPRKPPTNQGYQRPGSAQGNPAQPARGPIPINQARQTPQTPPPARQMSGSGSYQQPQAQAGMFARPPAQQKPRGNNYMLQSFILLIVVLVVIAAVIFVLPRLGSSTGTSTSSSGTATAAATAATGNGLGISMINNEPIGISDGSYAFDTSTVPAAGAFKKQAASSLASNPSQAVSLWRSALSQDPRDAESLIYLADQQACNSGSSHITIIVSTILDGANTNVGRDDLQGAYVAQQEFNANNGAKLGGVKACFLIANAGENSANATVLANQIVKAAHSDSHIVGVMGFPFSSYAENAMRVLGNAHIPVVSPTASSDNLTGISSYFFRVAPSNQTQAAVGAQYVMQKLNLKNVALFIDNGDSYSQSLGTDFQNEFTKQGGQIVDTESYTRGDATSVANGLKHALQQVPAPDLIYFAGYASDAGTVLTELPKYTNFPKLPVMGGDALYELGGYPSNAHAGFSRLHFTAFAYPDEWGILGYGSKLPAFFSDYKTAFSANGTKTGYGYDRPTSNVILSYDAMLATLSGSKNGLNGGTSLTPVQLQQGLAKITGAAAVQGVSGQISFSNGDPNQKPVVILAVDPQGHIMMEGLGSGTFLAPSS